MGRKNGRMHRTGALGGTVCDIIGDKIGSVLFKVTWLSINTINTLGEQLVSSSGFVWLQSWEVLVQDRQQFAFRSLGLNAAQNSKRM